MKKRLAAALLLFMYLSAPPVQADLLSPVIDLFQGIMKAIARDSVTRNAEQTALLHEDQIDREPETVPLTITPMGSSLLLDWSGHVPPAMHSQTIYTVQKSSDGRVWQNVTVTEETSFLDEAPLALQVRYRVITRTGTATGRSNYVLANPASTGAGGTVLTADSTGESGWDKTITVTLSFAEPTLADAYSGYQIFEAEGLSNEAQAGEPLLPYLYTHILIPEGYTYVTSSIETTETTSFDNLLLAPQQDPVPIGKPAPGAVTVNEQAYLRTTSNEQLRDEREQSLAGYTLLPIMVTPVRYVPKERKAYYATSAKLTIGLNKDGVFSQKSVKPSSRRQLDHARTKVSSLIANREDLPAETLRQQNTISPMSTAYDYLIIAPSAWREAYQPFIDFKNSKGLRTFFAAVEDIDVSQSGYDLAEKIRNYIRQVYSSYGIRYVLLGADTEYIPVRRVPSYYWNWGYSNIETDVYYGCLDGNWDSNGNRIYCETGDYPDRYAEVAVGRFPASGITEAKHMIEKSMEFERLDVTGPQMDDLYIFSEKLDDSTPAKLFIDYISPRLSGTYRLSTFADTASWYTSWNGSTFINALNSNSAQIYIHLGHSNQTYNSKINNADIPRIQNEIPYLMYSQGCFANYFLRNDAISEEHLKSNHGAAAFIGNTHFGWYYSGRGDGPSTRYQERFFSGVLDKNITEIGDAVTYARESLNTFSSVYRMLYLCINVLGDPSLNVVKEFVPRYGVKITNSIPDWVGKYMTINYRVTGEGLQTQSMYYRMGENDTWKFKFGGRPGPAESFNTFLTTGMPESPDYQFKIVAQYEGGVTAESEIVDFGLDYTPPATATTVQSRTYGSAVTINLIPSDNLSGVEVTRYSVGDIKDQIYTGPIQVSQGGDYCLTFYSIDRAGNVQPTVTVNFSIDTTIQDGFPIHLEGAIYGVPAYKDIDGDGYPEIAVLTGSGKLYLYNHDGTPFTGWEGGKLIGSRGASSPAFADVDNDGQDEIVAFGSYAGLNVFDLSGTLQWSRFAGDWSNNSSPVIADINHDNVPDIIIAADGILHVCEGINGTDLPGFPCMIDNGQSIDIFGTPAVADLNGDGHVDIVLAFSTAGDQPMSKVKVFGTGGNFAWVRHIDSAWMTGSPVIGDINNDGKPEIIVAGGQLPQVFAYDPQGNLIPGFPFSAPGGHFAMSPVLADLDDDRHLDIIIPNLNPAGNRLYAITWRGTTLPGFPVHSGEVEFSSGAVIGDIDGDGSHDIVIGGNKDRIYAYSSSGQQISGFPKLIGNTLSLSPSLMDIDGNGLTDILAADWSGRVTVWETTGVHDRQHIPWSTFQRDMYHTGFYPTVFLVKPAAGSRTAGDIEVAVKTFGNRSWINTIDYEYSTDSTDGVNGTWHTAAGYQWDIHSFVWSSTSAVKQGYVYLRARCRTAEGSYSGYVHTRIFVDNSPPSPVTGLTVTDPQDNGEKLILSWQKSADDGAGYNDVKAYRLTIDDGEYVRNVTLNRGMTDYEASTSKIRTYRFSVTALDDFHESTAATLEGIVPQDEIPPYPATDFTATDLADDNGGAVSLTWKHSPGFSADPHLTYTVLRREPGEHSWLTIHKGLRLATFIDWTATLNHTFQYLLLTTDTAFQASSNVVTAESSDNLPPALPRIYTICDVPSDNGEEVAIRWELSADDGTGQNDLSSYRLHINDLPPIEVPSGTTTFTLENTTKNIRYTFILSVTDYSGNEQQTPPVSCYALDNLPPALPGFSIGDVPEDQGGSLALLVNRSADDGSGQNDVTGYSLLRSTRQDGSGAAAILEWEADGSDSYSMPVTAPTNSICYYSVRVSDGANSTQSAFVRAVALDNIAPQAPAALTASDTPSDNGDQITLSWTPSPDDNSGAHDVASYALYRSSTGTTWEPVAILPAGTASFMDAGRIKNCSYRYLLVARDTSNTSNARDSEWVTARDNLPPAAVTAFSATDTAGDNGYRIALAWQPNTDDTICYEIFRDGSFIASMNAGTKTFTDNVSENYRTYTYRITAFDGTFRTVSTEVTADARDNLTEAPMLTSVDDVPGDNGGALRITWRQDQPDPYITTYLVIRNGRIAARLTADTFSFFDTNATKDVTITYAVKSVDCHGNEATGNRLSGKSIDNIAPYPIELQGSDVENDNGTAVRLWWTFDTYQDDVRYSLQRDGAEIAILTGNTTACTDYGVQPGLPYSYRIQADDIHNVTFSNTVRVVPEDNCAPEFDAGLRAEDTPGDNGGSITLTWAPSPALDLKLYRIYRGQTGEALQLLTAVSPNAAVYQDSIPSGVTYSYQVAAYDGTYEVRSSTAAAAAFDNVPPNPAIRLLAEDCPNDTGTALRLSWVLTEKDVSCSVYRDGILLLENYRDKEYTDTSLTKNRTYTYRVDTCDGTYVTRSEPVSGTPRDNIVNPVTHASVSDIPDDQGTALLVSWQPPADGDLRGFRLYRGEAVIAELTISANAFTDTGVQAGHRYEYRIETIDDSGNTCTVSVTGEALDNIPPRVPESLTITDPIDNGGVLVVSGLDRADDTTARYTLLRMKEDDRWETVATFGAHALSSYTDTGLDMVSHYRYMVRAEDTAHVRESAMTAFTAPQDEIVPQAVDVTSIDNPDDEGGVIKIYWTPSDVDVSLYRMYRSGVLIATTNELLYYDTALQARYAVEAVDHAGNTAISKATQLTKAYDNIPDVFIADVEPDLGNQIRLGWSTDDPTMKEFTLKRGISPDDFFMLVHKTYKKDETFVDTTVTRNTRYYYQLIYENSTGVHTLVFPGCTPRDELTPNPPTGLSVHQVPGTGGSEAGLTWNPVTANQATYLLVMRRQAGTIIWDELATLPATAVSYRDTTVQPGLHLDYLLRVCSQEYYSTSDIVRITVYDDTPPAAPQISDVPDDRGTQLLVSWTVPTVSSMYAIETGTGVTVSIVPAPSQQTVTVSGLSPASAYTFYYTVDREGHLIRSIHSAPVSPVINSYDSHPAGDLTATDVNPDNGDTVVLTWSGSPDDGGGYNDITAYLVYRDGVVIATLNKGVTSYTATNLSPSWSHPQGYTFTVGAVNVFGRTALSEAVSIAPADEKAPDVPVNLSCNATHGKALCLSWQTTSSDQDGFRIYRDGQLYASVPANTNEFLDEQVGFGVCYAYQVSAFDPAGNQSALSEAAYGTAAEGIDLHAGLNLFSIPYRLDSRSLAECLPGIDFTAYAWNGSSYTQVTDICEPGQAYFISLPRDVTLTLNNPQPLQEDVRKELKRGWNLIANPFTTPLGYPALSVIDGGTTYTMAEAIANRIISACTYTLDNAGTGYEQSYELLPAGGAWIKAYKPVTIVFPRHPAASGGVVVSGIRAHDWTLTFSLGNRHVTIGQSPSAADEYDPEDLAAPPKIASLGSTSDIHINNPDWGVFSGPYNRDIRNNTLSWKLTVVSAEPGTVQLNIGGLQKLPPGYTLVLTDQAGNRLPVKNDTVQLTCSSELTVLNVSISAISESFSVTDIVSYPNPCNITQQPVRIRYTSNQPGSGRLTIYSINGRNVYSRTCSFINGENILTWDGETTGGEEAASGLYIYLLELTSETGDTVKKKGRIVIWNN